MTGVERLTGSSHDNETEPKQDFCTCFATHRLTVYVNKVLSVKFYAEFFLKIVQTRMRHRRKPHILMRLKFGIDGCENGVEDKNKVFNLHLMNRLIYFT